MNNMKLAAGSQAPTILVPSLSGGSVDLFSTSKEGRWKMVVVYRGKHCPICTDYLVQLNELASEFDAVGVDIVAVSADSLERAQEQIIKVSPSYDVAYDLSFEQMRELGIYISEPRSPEESDRGFAEPGLFIVNEKGQVQVIDISNTPFTRPDFNTILMGIKFVRNPQNNYPIRGTL
ncbi:AhpC/TSA family protein [Vibrio parahaemolyticus]|nr:AhpC/TSA family protein [Vibrio parahaemolyticus]